MINSKTRNFYIKIYHSLIRLFTIFIIIFCASSCGSLLDKKNQKDPELKSGSIKYIPVCPDSKSDPEAFQMDETIMNCGPDTFIIKAQGTASEKYKNSDPETRKKQARQSAILNARYSFFEEMKKLRSIFVKPLNTDKVNYDFTGIDPWYLDLIKILKSGKVLCESYDTDQVCTLIYGFYIKDFSNWIKAE